LINVYEHSYSFTLFKLKKKKNPVHNPKLILEKKKKIIKMLNMLVKEF